MATREAHPYIELDRAAWAALAERGRGPAHRRTRSPRLRGLGDELDLEEVREVYLPISGCSACTSRRPARCTATRRRSSHQATAAADAVRHRPRRLGRRRQVDDRAACSSSCSRTGPSTPTSRWSPPTASSTPTPSSSAADCCSARASRSPTTAGRCSASSSTSSPARTRSTAPVYSHLIYDVVPDEQLRIKHPDIVIIEGLNVLQPARVRDDGRTGLAVSDFFDFSVYVDAETSDIRDWYVSRFLRLRETAFRDPASYFAPLRLASPDDEAVAEASGSGTRSTGPT